MNPFDKFIYSILDRIIAPSSTVALMVFLWGGFILSLFFAIFYLLPWFRNIPSRFYVAGGSLLTVVVPIYAGLLKPLIPGRGVLFILAFSPCALLVLPSVLSLVNIMKRTQRDRKVVYTVVVLSTIFAQLWALLVSWLATDPSFMGASC